MEYRKLSLIFAIKSILLKVSETKTQYEHLEFLKLLGRVSPNTEAGVGSHPFHLTFREM